MTEDSFYSGKANKVIEDMLNSGYFKVDSRGRVWRQDTTNQYKKATGVWRPADTSLSRGKRRVIRFNSRNVYASRFVWSWYRGAIPENMVIDHIDGDCLNNQIDNLQCITAEDNFNKAILLKEIKGGTSERHKQAIREAWKDPVKRTNLLKNQEKATAAAAKVRKKSI